MTAEDGVAPTGRTIAPCLWLDDEAEQTRQQLAGYLEGLDQMARRYEEKRERQRQRELEHAS